MQPSVTGRINPSRQRASKCLRAVAPRRSPLGRVLRAPSVLSILVEVAPTVARQDSTARERILDGADEGTESVIGVSTDAVAVGLIDTETATITAGNRAYAEMLGRTPEAIAGLPVEAMMAPERAAAARATLTAMRDGWIEFLEGEAELHRPSGPITVCSWSWTSGAGVPRMTVIGAGLPMAAGPDHALARPAVDAERVIIGTLDHDWRYQHFATRCTSLLGWPAGREGASRLHEIVHPADAGALAAVLDPTAIEIGPRTADLRLSGRDEVWLDARVTVSRLYGLPAAPFALVIGLVDAPNRAKPIIDRVNHLEAKLARIGAEVRSAGVVQPRSAVSFIELTGLTQRQNEIVRRLVGGQQVETIAGDLFVSPSTVRNHLSAIYKALGVKSQSELIRHVLTQQPSPARQNG